MNKGYWIVSVDISDTEKFSAYASKTPNILAKFGGRFLARAGQFEVAEGNARSRNALIEFPSYQAAVDCWNSEEYQNVKLIRVGGAEMDIIILEGC